MRELATYIGVLYAGLNAVSLVSIFVFDYYEQVLGGPLANATLGAMLAVPVVIATGLGYALSAYARDRKFPTPSRPYLVATVGAAISLVLVFGTAVIEALTPSEWFGTGAIAAYFVALGVVTPWITTFRRRNVTGAA